MQGHPALWFIVITLFCFGVEGAESGGAFASCVLHGLRGFNFSGSILFESQPGSAGLTATASVTGVHRSDDAFGFYLHQFGDLRSADAVSLGGVAASDTQAGGCPFWSLDKDSLTEASESGPAASMSRRFEAMSLVGPGSIVGQAIALRTGVHCDTLGESIAVCVVGIAGPAVTRKRSASDAASSSAFSGGAGAATRATCVLQPSHGSRLTGTVHFEAFEGITKISGLFSGVMPGHTHGVHIHQFGDLRDPGAHFDPYGVMRHALPLVDMRHVGDLGNIVGFPNGTACYYFENELVTLSGLHDVVGRALLVDLGADDGCTQPDGNSGGGAASCVIGVANPSVPFPSFECPTKQQRGNCQMPVETLRVPPGFKVSTFASNVGFARKMVRSPSGIIFVGSMNLQHFNTTVQSGISNVHALVDSDGDNVIDQYYTLIRDLSVPAGVDFRDGSLYVSLLDRILRLDDIENRLDNPPEPVVVTTAFPNDIWHGWKFIKFGPDGMLYVPVGAPCNTCNCSGLFCTLTKLDVTDPAAQPIVVFEGMRNSVGFDWDPLSGDLWWTDNGRDEWGNDTPPDELNRMPAELDGQLHFGFPYCYGKNLSDPAYNTAGSCSPYVPAAFDLGPHVAALGMRFYDGTMFPPKYQKPGRVFIAEHGSWNREQPIGYRVTTVNIHDPNSYEVFIDGWLQPPRPGQPPIDPSAPNDTPNAWGRPTDVLVMPDGSLLIADDKASAIYRVTYEDPAQDTASG
eukprot:TRINITY_DN6027_c0_g2_i1.p1 TRINITY_DN6027_c0_g2~~TRINITY_DN6027_c0_g2_i1.p1  ORF type:complete len:742 (+),score=236.53 TRINITY_DN6027_c0_g2_i1:850-3075(+)